MAPILSRLPLLLALLGAAARAPAAAETRCGWIENPTPANFFLADADGTWILSSQGSPAPPGMDLVPDLTTHEFVVTNGSHGYACGCLDAMFDKDKRATRIESIRQSPLATCRKDGRLPKP